MAKKRAVPSDAPPSTDDPAATVGLLRAGVRRLEWMDPREIAANPANFRVHPPEQVASLRESIADNGWSKPLILSENSGLLLDGHARLALAIEDGEESIPVNVGWWTGAQEAQLLATLDAIAAGARVDPDRFGELRAALDEFRPDLGDATRELLDAMTADPFAVGDHRPVHAGNDFIRTQSGPIGEDDTLARPVAVTVGQRHVFAQAVARIRDSEGDCALSEGRCLELICADFLAGA